MPRLSPVRLGVNIDHIATLRNARGGTFPDPIIGAKVALDAGADGITAHLREDRRHILDADMYRLQQLCLSEGRPLNMEMAVNPEMIKIAKDIQPHAVCLVPEKREERTTEGGLDVAAHFDRLKTLIPELTKAGMRVSLFIEADPRQIELAAKLKAPAIEIHTGAYAHAFDEKDPERATRILETIYSGVDLAYSLGLEVHAGHGLTFENVSPIAAIAEIRELNIGHFLIGEAVFQGLPGAVSQMKRIIMEARL